jgi:hypothetical protein
VDYAILRSTYDYEAKDILLSKNMTRSTMINNIHIEMYPEFRQFQKKFVLVYEKRLFHLLFHFPWIKTGQVMPNSSLEPHNLAEICFYMK